MFYVLEKRRWLSILLFVVITLQIFWLSSIPSVGPVEIGQTKTGIFAMIYHFCAFFLFAFFLTSSQKKKEITKKTILIVVAVSILYAILDEVHQIFVPGRSPSIKDVVIDSLGIFFATIIYSRTSKKMVLISQKNQVESIRKEMFNKK